MFWESTSKAIILQQFGKLASWNLNKTRVTKITDHQWIWPGPHLAHLVPVHFLRAPTFTKQTATTTTQTTPRYRPFCSLLSLFMIWRILITTMWIGTSQGGDRRLWNETVSMSKHHFNGFVQDCSNSTIRIYDLDGRPSKYHHSCTTEIVMASKLYILAFLAGRMDTNLSYHKNSQY